MEFLITSQKRTDKNGKSFYFADSLPDRTKTLVYGEIEDLRPGKIIKTDRFTKTNSGSYIARYKNEKTPKNKEEFDNTITQEQIDIDEATAKEIFAGDKGYVKIFNKQPLDENFDAFEYYYKYGSGYKKETAVLTKNGAFIFGGAFKDFEKVRQLSSRLKPEVLKIFNRAPSGFALYGKEFGEHGEYFYAVFYKGYNDYRILWSTGQDDYSYSPNAIRWRIDEHPLKKDETTKIKVRLDSMDYMTYNFRINPNKVLVVSGTFPTNRIFNVSYDVINQYNPELAKVICSRSLNNVKKIFDGELELDVIVRESYGQKYISKITGVKIDDAVFNKLKKIVRDRELAAELKKALKEARLAGDFYNRQKLINMLMASKQGTTEEEAKKAIDKKFNRRKYDETYFRYLEQAANGDENIFMNDESFIFIIKSSFGSWRVVETPGISAATYLFDQTISDVNQLLTMFESMGGVKAVFTAENNLSDDEELIEDPRKDIKLKAAELRKKTGFLTRIIHKNFTSWKMQLIDLINSKDVIDPLYSDSKPTIAQKIKKAAQARFAQQKRNNPTV